VAGAVAGREDHEEGVGDHGQGDPAYQERQRRT
jgi:hypothetical protein